MSVKRRMAAFSSVYVRTAELIKKYIKLIYDFVIC